MVDRERGIKMNSESYYDPTYPIWFQQDSRRNAKCVLDFYRSLKTKKEIKYYNDMMFALNETLVNKLNEVSYKLLSNMEIENYYTRDRLNTGIASWNWEYPLIKIKLNYLMFNRADRFDISFSKNAMYLKDSVFTCMYMLTTNNIQIRSAKINFENKLKKEGLKWTTLEKLTN